MPQTGCERAESKTAFRASGRSRWLPARCLFSALRPALGGYKTEKRHGLLSPLEGGTEASFRRRSFNHVSFCVLGYGCKGACADASSADAVFPGLAGDFIGCSALPDGARHCPGSERCGGRGGIGCTRTGCPGCCIPGCSPRPDSCILPDPATAGPGPWPFPP